MKVLREILFFLISMAGATVTLAFDENKEVRELVKAFIKKIPDKPWTDYMLKSAHPGFVLPVLFVIFLVLGVIAARITRLFTTSKNLNRVIEANKWFTFIFICIPVTMVLIHYEQLFLRGKESAFYFLYTYIVFYGTARLLEFILSQSFVPMISKPLPNCRLQICTLKAEDDFEVTSVVTKRKMTFEECHTCMRNLDVEFAQQQFFRIVETRLIGEKIIDEWKYYRDGSNIRDDEALKKLFTLDTQVKWGM